MRLMLLTICFSFTITAYTQDSDVGNWLLYFGNKKINDQWNWHHEMQYRSFNAVGDLEQLLVRTGIGYNLSSNNNNLLLGYAYILSEPYLLGTDDKIQINEHRIYQQFITRQQFGRFYFQHRYRLEERFIEDDYRTRFRYFLSILLPLNQNTLGDKALYLHTYNELFIHTTSAVFDRNRLYGAIGYNFNKHLRVELGYMSQLQENRHREQFQLVTFGNF
jgi:hypothetical protein